jgi:ribonuclease BN (tRNA processing enzyme)
MKIIFLGTNGWYTSPTGNTPCILVDSKDYYVVLDAGNGIYKLDKYIKEDRPIYLFVSHFHIDHVSGFHTLAKFNFSQGLNVCVADGRKKDFDILVNPPYTIGIKDKPENIGKLPYEVRLHELTENNNNLPFPVSCIELYHAYTGHGYRFELEGKTIAYSGDTGICDNSKILAKNADVLIHECSWETAPKDNKWGHSDPTLASNLAKQANVKQLILTHFDASVYTTFEKRDIAEKKAQQIFPNTTAARDEMVINL